MSRYTSKVKLEVSFDGDNVEMVMQRLTHDQMGRLSPYIKVSDGATKVAFSDQTNLLLVSRDILKESVLEFRGLKDAGGNAITLEEATSQTYFASLISKMLGFLLENSFLQEADAKKSGPLLTG